MNTTRILLFAFVLGICAPLQVFPQGYLIPGSVTYEGYIPGWGAEIHVRQNPTNSDYTGFVMNLENGTTFSFFTFLDEGVRVFFVEANNPIDVVSIQANSYPELTYPNTYQIPNGSQFLVGLYTGYSPANGIYSNPMFGWAELFNNNGTIQLVDSALAYGSQGILAGTQTLVPEPSSFCLFSLGLTALWSRRLLRR